MKWGSLSSFVNHSMAWNRTPEGWEYWKKLYGQWIDLEEEALELRFYLSKFNVLGHEDRWGGESGQPLLSTYNEDYLLYVQLQLIAKYWNRFGNLPSVELLEELR